MSKLGFMLIEDYIKPRINFNPTQASLIEPTYGQQDHDKFIGLEHLSQLLISSKGFIVNAFHIDYFQTLPRLIVNQLQVISPSKKLYILGPELSLSIIKRKFNQIHERQFSRFEYLSIERTSLEISTECQQLLSQGHVIYVLPETLVNWQPIRLSEEMDSSKPLCSAFLSQSSKFPVLSATSDNTNQINLHKPIFPNAYKGKLLACVAEQSEDIYDVLTTSTED